MTIDNLARTLNIRDPKRAIYDALQYWSSQRRLATSVPNLDSGDPDDNISPDHELCEEDLPLLLVWILQYRVFNGLRAQEVDCQIDRCEFKFVLAGVPLALDIRVRS